MRGVGVGVGRGDWEAYPPAIDSILEGEGERDHAHLLQRMCGAQRGFDKTHDEK